MSITLLGLLTVTATAVAVLMAKRRLIWLLVAVAPFTRSAAITFGENALSPFYVVAIPATIAAVVAWLNGTRTNKRPLRVLGAFIVWALLVTATSPGIFSGTPVLNPRGGIDDQVRDPAALDYTVSMGAQALYLVLAGGVVLYIAQAPKLHAGILTPAVALGTLLSAARLLPGGPEVLDPIFRYYGAAGFNQFETRHFGIFFEPSYLASFSLAAIAYCLYRMRLVSGAQRLGVVLVLGLAVLNVSLSAAGTAVAASLVLTGVVVVIYGGRFLFSGAKLHPLFLLVPFALLLVIITPNRLSASFRETITSKVGSVSFASRSTSDVFSLGIVQDTWGLGAGLGANRPSSFLTLVLSTVGIIGFVLLAVFLVRAIRGGLESEMFKPAAAALIALLVAKATAEPDLSSPLLWVLAAICVQAAPTPPPATSQNAPPSSRPARRSGTAWR